METIPHRLLFVEDNKELIFLCSRVMSHAGYNVHEAHDGRQAMELLEHNAFDILITDIMLPGVSGLEVIKFAKRRYPEMPVVAVSAAGEEALEKANLCGADLIIPKPFIAEKLTERIRRLLPRRRRQFAV